MPLGFARVDSKWHSDLCVMPSRLLHYGASLLVGCECDTYEPANNAWPPVHAAWLAYLWSSLRNFDFGWSPMAAAWEGPRLVGKVLGTWQFPLDCSPPRIPKRAEDSPWLLDEQTVVYRRAATFSIRPRRHPASYGAVFLLAVAVEHRFLATDFGSFVYGSAVALLRPLPLTRASCLSKS